MGTFLARKFFSRRVTISSGVAISFASLMRSAAGTTNTPQWGKNADGSNSMDSFWGDGATIIPASQTIYVGFTSDVADVNSASTYEGVPCAAAVPFNLQDYIRGPVDTEQVWIFSRNAQSVDLIFQGAQ